MTMSSVFNLHLTHAGRLFNDSASIAKVIQPRRGPG